MRLRTIRHNALLASSVVLLPASVIVAGAATAQANTAITPQQFTGQVTSGATFNAKVILSGAQLKNNFMVGTTSMSEPLTQPDDITRLGSMLYVAFQNNVGPMGQPNANGNLNSTIVEFTASGQYVTQWSLPGHIDGLTADAVYHQLIVTVNEDGNSSMFTINPSAFRPLQVQSFRYNEVLAHGGGTDAISIYQGQIFVSASAPTVATGPAVYKVSLDWATHVAMVTPVFYDNSVANNANIGTEGTTTLALTDPDSNEVVPNASPRFGGDFVLDSQGDQEQIYVHNAGQANQTLNVLTLSQSINDTAWATSTTGTLYATDNAQNEVLAVTGKFQPGTSFVAVTPCDANTAPSVCPSTGYPANYLGTLNMFTGAISPVNISGVESFEPGGLLFVSSDNKFCTNASSICGDLKFAASTIMNSKTN